jgi:hypothetical protein
VAVRLATKRVKSRVSYRPGSMRQTNSPML